MTTLSGDLELHPIDGEALTLSQQVKLFHLLAVVIDPYTYESSWLLDTADRVLSHFSGSSCRAAFVVTADEAGARSFLGPLADRFVVFCDPDRKFVAELGVGELPAFAAIDLNCEAVGVAEGWDPETWRPIAENIADVMQWSRPYLPAEGDPSPYPGSPAGV